MKIIECPCTYDKEPYEVPVFMGGGMSNVEWHDRFLNELDKTPNSLVIYNPYNPNIIKIEDQIEWEFNYLNKYIKDYFIFSMYFDKYTKQPMSMYELGRATVLSQTKSINITASDEPYSRCGSFYVQQGFPMVISYHKESPCRCDVKAQLDLLNICSDVRTPEEHAKQVLFWYNNIKGRI